MAQWNLNAEAVRADKAPGWGPWVPSGGGSTGPSHPMATAGEWMALAAIMENFDSTNGLSMAWDNVTVIWGQRVSSLSAGMSSTLDADYSALQTYVDANAGSPPDSFSEEVTKLQVKYQTDQTTDQNAMQQPQSELDKQTQSVKDLGTVTQQGLQNASSILGIANNTAQQMAK